MAVFEWEKRLVSRLLRGAAVELNGANPWDIQVHDDALYRKILYQGSLGLGEAYIEGLWDCEALDALFQRISRHGRAGKHWSNIALHVHRLRNLLFNLQGTRRAKQLRHYDIGNDLYRSMLDQRMVYSCAYWPEAGDLDAAQQAKLKLVCEKVSLRPGMRVLDIGCGWGSLMKYAAEHYGVSCIGVTNSPAQVELGRQMCAGLPVEFTLQDYRSIRGKFDAIVSIGMFEHVGRHNYRQFMRIVRASLNPHALFLLHTIGARSSSASDTADPWLSRHIFPHGELPGMAQIAAASDGVLAMEDWHNFGADYAHTLLAWHANFERAWPQLADRYDEHFYRLWGYYLLSCAGLFRARAAHVWQIVFSRRGVSGGYRSLR